MLLLTLTRHQRRRYPDWSHRLSASAYSNGTTGGVLTATREKQPCRATLVFATFGFSFDSIPLGRPVNRNRGDAREDEPQ